MITAAGLPGFSRSLADRGRGQGQGIVESGGIWPRRQAAERRNPLQHQREQQGDRSRSPTCGTRSGHHDFRRHRPEDALRLRSGGDYNVARAGSIGDYSDPQNFLFLLKGECRARLLRWANPAYDALLAKAARDRDLKARAKILAEAEAILLRDQPVVRILSTVQETGS